MSSSQIRFNSVRARISDTAQSLGNSHEPLLLAVSKTRSAQEIRNLFDLGQRDFGENYVQEALEKIEALTDLNICWHFIGPLQSNKSRLVAENFAWVHSVDSLKIAQRLSKQRPEGLPKLQICVQVNIDEEPSKSGVNPGDIEELVKQIAVLPNLNLRGLMCIPKKQHAADKTLASFGRLRQLRDSLNTKANLALDTLSMGMSADLELAMQEQATIVRIGTALFGPRK